MWNWLAKISSRREQKQVYDRLIQTPDFKFFLHNLMHAYRFQAVTDPKLPEGEYKWREGQKSVIQGILDVLDKDVMEFSDAIPDFSKRGDVIT